MLTRQELLEMTSNLGKVVTNLLNSSLLKESDEKLYYKLKDAAVILANATSEDVDEDKIQERLEGVCEWVRLPEGQGKTIKDCDKSIQQAGWASVYKNEEGTYICGHCQRPTKVVECNQPRA